MCSAGVKSSVLSGAAHPNEFDRKRIERAIQVRERYQYVSPSVAEIEGGYRVESPCCSRKIDPEGGVIDIALMRYDPHTTHWRLFYKDHGRDCWEFHSTHHRLHELLQGLNSDPERIFWQ
ncbi:DUF3024 domain-containing protein [Thalassospira sp. MA62]|nr:DUF3024 domain-containing protein [Thalassospira sp. MA62]